ncbi:urocanate hydratase [Brachionus plicatilis]|uniref:urocanate hydratase n=1 Tax=Brachionus plicatilis TaxID=10195 RepID=A0A3M7QJF5_BRAPC|nr:urocanate hydratase [Brachionus plicatilis]
MVNEILKKICSGLPLDPLPENLGRNPNIAHAAKRVANLSKSEKQQAISNALRYFPTHLHKILAREFADELEQYGHIYMYRFLPRISMKAYPVGQYPCKTVKAAAMMLMIMNNLDPQVAQFPEELITYGGNGQVFSNWAQFWLVMNYLSELDDEQTLVMYSGHPLGLFPSSPSSPRCVITNGMVIPNYSSKEDYEKYFALGVSMYGQMTAGSYCYIGPQGIVHGTYLTVLNIFRKYFGSNDLRGRVFLSSGLGGMSGAQAKAGYLLDSITVIAEVSEEALMKRHRQGWVLEVIKNIKELINRIAYCKREKVATSIAYHGNIVDIWEALVEHQDQTGELLVDLGSDQTSCHNPYLGGYFPVQLSYEESLKMMHEHPKDFKLLVQESLRRQYHAIDKLGHKGLVFWDYGNAFLLEVSRAFQQDNQKSDALSRTKFKYPSYMQDVMGDIFSLGFGPFRWICTSCDDDDLRMTDKAAQEVFEQTLKSSDLPEKVRHQYEDNLKWIKEAESYQLVVGSKARILYADQLGRCNVSLAMNKMVRDGILKGPVVISRDHHDVSGTDSPFRETSNIYDGSAFTADMAVQNFIGDGIRGATWVSLHNGGGVGWGEVMNGGFGLVLDGSEQTDKIVKSMVNWDVLNGVARRSWSGNQNAKETIVRAMNFVDGLKVTVPVQIEDETILNNL